MKRYTTSGPPEPPARQERLDTLFRQRLRARNAAGCQSLIAAAEEGGGTGDPLLDLCRGLVASELTHDWGAADVHFQEVLTARELPVTLHARSRSWAW
jgi:hypothetical protein